MVNTNSTIFISSQVFNYVCLFHFKVIYISFPRGCRLQKLETMAEKFAEYELQCYYILQNLVEYWDFFKTSLISVLRSM